MVAERIKRMDGRIRHELIDKIKHIIKGIVIFNIVLMIEFLDGLTRRHGLWLRELRGQA